LGGAYKKTSIGYGALFENILSLLTNNRQFSSALWLADQPKKMNNANLHHNGISEIIDKEPLAGYQLIKVLLYLRWSQFF